MSQNTITHISTSPIISKRMNKLIITIGIASTLFACGSKEANNSITELTQKKDSLKTIYSDIATQIASIDEQLKVLDTTIKLPIVTAGIVEEKAFEHFVEIQGAVEVGGNALLYPEVPGKIVSIPFKEGSRVAKGATIIKLDAGTLNSTIKEVETSYGLAKDIYEKQDRLWKDKIGSEVQYLQAKTNKEGLEQKLITLNKQLEMYSIKAPFSGVIDEINPKVGESANPAFPAVRVINYDDTYLKADVSENYINTIKQGAKVEVHFPSLDKNFVTTIARIGNYINPNNRTFKVNVDLNEFKENLKPNLLADLKIRDFNADTAVVVLSKIIQQDRKGNEYTSVLFLTFQMIVNHCCLLMSVESKKNHYH